MYNVTPVMDDRSNAIADCWVVVDLSIYNMCLSSQKKDDRMGDNLEHAEHCSSEGNRHHVGCSLLNSLYHCTVRCHTVFVRMPQFPASNLRYFVIASLIESDDCPISNRPQLSILMLLVQCRYYSSVSTSTIVPTLL